MVFRHYKTTLFYSVVQIGVVDFRVRKTCSFGNTTVSHVNKTKQKRRKKKMGE